MEADAGSSEFSADIGITRRPTPAPGPPHLPSPVAPPPNPPAATPGVVDPATHQFVIPKKEVSSAADIEKWEHSAAYKDLIGFLLAMSESVKGKTLRQDVYLSETVTKCVEMLDRLDKWIDETPPIEQPQRFGNKAFRIWFDRLKDNAEGLVKEVLDEKFHPALPEITTYLVESVGNQTRIDYGTGHELAFVAFLICLFKIGALLEEDSAAAVLKLFNRYIILVRKLQKTYRMEPAGSQGVWSLDDYQFISFIFGAAQLIDHPRLKPKSFVNEDYVRSFSKDFMFLGCIEHIMEVKTGPFAEHSNQLWNISGVPQWSKVQSGLIKMYKAEVLNKFPVIQHFLFGSLLSIARST